MPIHGICPKCGRTGTQVIFRPHLKHKDQNYMKYNHSDGSQCYVGRVKTTDEVIGELERPQSQEEYEKALKDVMKEIKLLVKHYEGNKNISGSLYHTLRVLKGLIQKYGY